MPLVGYPRIWNFLLRSSNSQRFEWSVNLEKKKLHAIRNYRMDRMAVVSLFSELISIAFISLFPSALGGGGDQSALLQPLLLPQRDDDLWHSYTYERVCVSRTLDELPAHRDSYFFLFRFHRAVTQWLITLNSLVVRYKGRRTGQIS